MVRLIGLALITILLCSSCEKNISIKVPDTTQNLVVEGYIENGQPPVVILSTSLNYFSQIDSTIINNLFVHGAQITINNGTRQVSLKEYEIDTTNGEKFFLYSIDSSMAGSFVGVPGGQYNLSIQVNGNTYSATTSIPAYGIILDSLYALKVIPTNQNPDTNLIILVGRFTDPPQLGDYARYFTKTNSGPFYPPLNSVADDELVNGTTFDITLAKGVDRNQPIPNNNNYGTFEIGDTITVKFCDIDKATYDFWRTWEYAFNDNGNPFSSPIDILGNISNGALGYWGGYNAMFKTIIVR
jgi:Domain of unknown function (DUF4249)